MTLSGLVLTSSETGYSRSGAEWYSLNAADLSVTSTLANSNRLVKGLISSYSEFT